MITALAAVVLSVPGQANPAALVGNMLAYYSDAKTMTGRITMTQSANGQSGSIETFLQYDAPSKIYLRQQKLTGDKRVWLLVSDGKKFAYNSPGLPSEDQGKRLVELVSPRPEVKLTYRDMYAAASAGLGDRSAPLDIAIGRKEDLQYLRHQWATVSYRGKTKHDGAEVHEIVGDWRPYGEAPVQGQFRMFLTDDGQLKQYARSETVRPEGVSQPINVITTWEVKLTKNGMPDVSLFTSVK